MNENKMSKKKHISIQHIDINIFEDYMYLPHTFKALKL